MLDDAINPIHIRQNLMTAPFTLWLYGKRPIEGDGLPNLKMGASFHGERLINQMVNPIIKPHSYP